MTHTLKDASQNYESQTQTYTEGSLPLNKTWVKDIAGFIRKLNGRGEILWILLMQ